MGAFYNGKKIGGMFYNGKTIGGAFLNGKKVFDSFDGLILTFVTNENIEIGLTGSVGFAYDWDIYINNTFYQNITGVTSSENVFVIPNSVQGTYIVKLVDKTGNDYCARSIRFYAPGVVTSSSGLTKVSGFGRAFYGETAMPSYCYSYMFNNCTSLTEAPELPATTLADGCYSYMFFGCTSLTEAPELPATTLADYCYFYMFNSCTSLTEAPELPATTLADGCYAHMFNNCTSLTEAPELPATTLATDCYAHMFNRCTSLTEAPELPATTLAIDCYARMFYRCTSLKSVKCYYPFDLSANYASGWLDLISTVGTLYSPNAIITYGKPENWTAQAL